MSFEILYVPDSFAAMRECPDREFDACITDGPYDAYCQQNQTSGTMMRDLLTGKRRGGIPKRELGWTPLSDYEWTRELVRTSKRWALSFGTMEAFGPIKYANGEDVLKSNGETEYQGDYVKAALWYKMNSMGQTTRDRPASTCEGIALLHRRDEKKRWNGNGSYNLWPANSTRGKKGRHVNEKPVDLCLKLVALFTERGETVVDWFCGSAAIGEACLRLGRNYVGFDFDPEWVTKAQERLYTIECNVADGNYLMTDEEALKLCTAKKSEILEVDQ